MTDRLDQIKERHVRGSISTVSHTDVNYLIERAEREGSLIDAIRHGDEEHQRWLCRAIEDHFAGRPIERPQGQSSQARAEKAEARVERLEELLMDAIPQLHRLAFYEGDINQPTKAFAEKISAELGTDDGTR